MNSYELLQATYSVVDQLQTVFERCGITVSDNTEWANERIAAYNRHCSDSMPPLLLELLCSRNGGKVRLTVLQGTDSVGIMLMRERKSWFFFRHSQTEAIIQELAERLVQMGAIHAKLR